jgi:hypothetical protein
MKLIERVELIGNYKLKIGKATRGRVVTMSLRPVRVVTDVELSGEKARNDTTPVRGRGSRAFRRSGVAFMKGIYLVAEAAGLPFIVSKPGPV